MPFAGSLMGIALFGPSNGRFLVAQIPDAPCLARRYRYIAQLPPCRLRPYWSRLDPSGAGVPGHYSHKGLG